MKPLDLDKLRDDPVGVAVAFTDAVKAYVDAPDDYDLRCRVLLLAGFLAGMSMRDKRDWERARAPIPHTSGCICVRCEQRPKRPGPRG